MFPRRELTTLAGGKAAIRARIARERSDCVAAVKTAARPLRWLDRLHARWQTTPTVVKFAAMPALVFLKAKFFPRKERRRWFARWVRLAWHLVRAVRD